MRPQQRQLGIIPPELVDFRGYDRVPKCKDVVNPWYEVPVAVVMGHGWAVREGRG